MLVIFIIYYVDEVNNKNFHLLINNLTNLFKKGDINKS